MSAKITLVSAALLAVTLIGYILYTVVMAVYDMAVNFYALIVIATLGGL